MRKKDVSPAYRESVSRRPTAKARSRASAARRDPGLEKPEAREDERGQGEAGPRPPRPPGVASGDQRIDEQQQPDGESRDAAQIQPAHRGLPRLAHEDGGRTQSEDPDGHVHEEDGAPGEAEENGLDQEPAEDLADDRGQAQCRPEEAEGGAPLVGREADLDDGKDLRDHEGRGEPLEAARGDEGRGAWREAA